MPKGKTPSLIGSSLGRPRGVIAGQRCACSRCKGSIIKDEKCYDIPQPQKKFATTRRFCSNCFREVLAKTKDDLIEVEAL